MLYFLMCESILKEVNEPSNKKGTKNKIVNYVNEIKTTIIDIVKPGESIQFTNTYWGGTILTQYQMNLIVDSLRINFPYSNISFETISNKGNKQQLLTIDL